MTCEFCKEGKTIEWCHVGTGQMTPKMMLDAMFSLGGDNSHVRIDGNILYYDNSSGEYAEQGIEINYCPMCGEKLEGGKDEV